MQRHIGDEFTATVGTVTSFGLFVTLNELFIEGLIHISNLGDGYFDYDEARQILSNNQGTVFGLGQQLVVRVAGVNMDLKQIDFDLVQSDGEPIVTDTPKSNKKPKSKAKRKK